ncbi:beta-propeller domain-containing protein [Anaeromyxobacter paludicola]|uniref:Lipoprotein n=1 Tax=Anaeromyxobacter paludicola TaxID=2918171 RepID=A0ABM7XD16_9BACT|nr:beta-propeller domain-containing protein [Anaeromyxobacter paludicola]BDG09775.1 hypothetical protein AMPC_28880 [Anaeromyxobacter paludicola]
MRVHACLGAAVALVLACSGSTGPRDPGQVDFLSQPPGGGRGGPAVPTGAPATTDGASGAATPRPVVESDLYQRQGDTLLVLDAWRGLLVLDLADPLQPRLLSRVPVLGEPVHLYRRGDVAFFGVRGAFEYAPSAGGAGPEALFGSELLAVDVSQPAAPQVLSRFRLDGELIESRIVGDVLYTVARRSGWWALGPPPGGVVAVGSAGGTGVAGGGAPAGADDLSVASFDLGDPRDVRQVQALTLDVTGWDAHAAIAACADPARCGSAARIVLSLSGYAPGGPTTRFQPIDVSDPGGALVAGASFDAEGAVLDRFAMDFDPASGLFRAALANGTSGGTLRLWRAPDVSAAVPAGSLTVGDGEALTAARFDGARAYLSTAARIDPLFVLDTSDPDHPVSLGQADLPGWLDALEPRGDQLLALGHAPGPSGAGATLALSLFDLSGGAPVKLSQVPFGATWGFVAASRDDLRKALTVVDGAGLVLVPVQGYDWQRQAWSGGTQLFDWTPGAPGPLVLRGFLSHPGFITRAFPLDGAAVRLAALSDEALQLLDASDRDHPAELARLELSRPVNALAIVRGAAAELCGELTTGRQELVVAPASEPDSASPLARLALPDGAARLFQDGDLLWLLTSDWRTGTAALLAVDLSDPAHPRLRGRLDLTPEEAGSWFAGSWGWGDQAVLAGKVLALHRAGGGYAVPLAAAAPGGAAAGAPADEVRLFDLADPDHPRRAAVVALPSGGWSWGLAAAGPYLWITHLEWVPDDAQGRVRYYVDRIDAGDPDRPVLLPKVNVPGVFAGASGSGARLYTLEGTWGDAPTTALHALDLTADGKARLAASATLPGWGGGALLAGGQAYLETWPADAGGARLAAVELASMRVTSNEPLPVAWGSLARAAGGKLFLQAGWYRSGVLVYDLADPARPAFERFVRTNGWIADVVVDGATAYLPSGPYGVQTVALGP